MKQSLLLISLCLTLALPTSAIADCFVAYKAKQDDPLRLHYGVLALPGDCPSKANAQTAAQTRLQSAGWTILNVITISETEPTAQMKADAGEHYLRY